VICLHSLSELYYSRYLYLLLSTYVRTTTRNRNPVVWLTYILYGLFGKKEYYSVLLVEDAISCEFTSDS
jgi:hypothetical protein